MFSPCPTPHSDLDLLVVLPEVEHKRDAAVAMRRVLSVLPVSKDVVVATPEEIEARRNSTWHIIARALDDGVTVYSREQHPDSRSSTLNRSLRMP